MLSQTYFSLINNFTSCWINNITKCSSVNAALVKCHDILGQRASFIRKYILDLAQLLVQCRCSSFGRRLRFFMKHFFIPVY